MKKRVLVGLIALCFLVGLLAVPALASADTTAPITITATPSYLCMTIAYNGAHSSTWALGAVNASTTYFWNSAEPGWPLTIGNCSANITNCGSIECDIDGNASAFTGGVGWTITTGAPGENTVQITAYANGTANEAAGVELETNAGNEIFDGIAASAVIGVELSLETGTFTDGVAKQGTVTFIIRATS